VRSDGQQSPRATGGPGPSRSILAIVLGVSVLCVLGAGVRTAWSERRAASLDELARLAPGPTEDPGFVTSDTCQACHPAEYASWHRTFHRRMTQVARPEAVLGDFSGTEVDYHGVTYRFSRRDDELLVTADGRERRVVLTTGSHHYQVYWVPSSDGTRLENLPLVYLLEDRRWVPRSDVFLVPPVTGFGPWKPRPWNLSCIQCHTTHGTAGFDPASGRMDTRVAETGIGCESCHGPSREHVERNRDFRRRYELYASDAPDPTIVNPADLPPDRASMVCGQCHSIFDFSDDLAGWYRRGFTYRAGGDLEATRFVARHPLKVPPEERPALVASLRRASIRPDAYFWEDGMVRVSGRDYNGLVESPCYRRGELSCLSCHSMHSSEPAHQLAAGMDGDQACLQCHGRIAEDLRKHTRHEPDSSGSRCYNCHMPYTSYGLLKAVRSHEIDSPTTESIVRGGRPNACNLCHLDQPIEWTARYLEEWYEMPPAALPADRSDLAAGLDWLLRGDAGQRAVVAWHFGWEPALGASRADWPAPFLARLLDDPYSTVRYVAYRSLRQLPGYSDFEYDFIASPAERARAAERAVAGWPGLEPDAPLAERPLAPVLLNPDGTVREAAVRELLRRRDDRDMALLE
jgi:predicted CXXCH cytochrome family protein